MKHGVVELLTENDIMEIGTLFLLKTAVDHRSGISASESADTIAKRVLTELQIKATFD